MHPFTCAFVSGVTSGIGNALCLRLAHQNMSLLITGRNAEKLDALKAQLEKKVPVTAICAHLDRREEREKVVQSIRRHVPDLLINNAGMSIYGLALDSSVSEQLSMLEVNGSAVLELTLEGAHALKRAKKAGVILNVASAAGLHPTPGISVYGASKAFVIQFSKGLDFELAPQNIRVLVSCPGQVDTDFSKKAAKSDAIVRKGPVMDLSSTVDKILWQIKKRKTAHLFDWRYKLASIFAPEWLVKKQIFNHITDRIGKTP